MNKRNTIKYNLDSMLPNKVATLFLMTLAIIVVKYKYY